MINYHKGLKLEIKNMILIKKYSNDKIEICKKNKKLQLNNQ